MKDTHRKRLRAPAASWPAALLPALLLSLPLTGCGKEKEPEPPAYQGPVHPPDRKPPREQPPAAPDTPPDAPPPGN